MYEAPVSNVLVGLADAATNSPSSVVTTTTTTEEEEETMIFPCL